ncbi:MAG: hypothetical protein EBR01_10070 [Proteobacteria bacterium]|jgi:S-adenosylmethionine decarboxylase|nr:hypothetical protein [Pseudomonadota bacterium]NBY20949.1 hypothetical protein [bacterium]
MIKELIIDAYGCELDLSEPKRIEKAARAALEAEGATVVVTSHYQFQPHGLTLCLILKESHFIISTWPEHKMAIINIFLCNDEMDTRRVWRAFSSCLRPSQETFHEVQHQIGSSPPVKKSA